MERTVKRSFLLGTSALFLSALLPFAASAHVPTTEATSHIETISGVQSNDLPDPILHSVAAYGTISQPGEADVYNFTPSQDGDLPIEAFVPVRVHNRFFKPEVIVANAHLPLLIDSPINLPDGFGGVLIPAPTETRSVFFEPFSQERLYHGVEQTIHVEQGRTYLVYVLDPQFHTGDYALGIGTVENFADVSTSNLIGQVGRIKLGFVSGDQIPWSDVMGLFLLMAGFCIGLGSVTTIDCIGFLGRRSPYWTQVAIRAHKVTKPLIWIGITLTILGGTLFYSSIGWTGLAPVHAFIALILIANGSYLSFVISPRLLQLEKEGKDKKVLPQSMQNHITLSFIMSFLSWWSGLFLFVWHLIVLR